MEYEVQWGEGPLGVTLRPDLGEDMPPVVGRITREGSAAAVARVQVGDMLVSINGIDTARQGYDHIVEMLKRIPRPAILKFRVPRQLSTKQLVPGSSSIHEADPIPPTLANLSHMYKTSTRPSTGSTASSRSTGSGNGSVSMGSTSGSMSGPSPGPRRSRGEQYTVVWTEGPLGMILRPDDDDVHVPCIRKITGRGAGTGMQRATVGDVLVAVNGQETKSMGFRSTISLLKTIRKPAILKFKSMHRRVRHTHGSDTVNPSPNPSLPRTRSQDSMSELLPPPTARSVGSYDIVWREGDLGLKLKAGPRDVPYLSKLTGKGTASGIKNACIGDELVSVNGVPVEGHAYRDTLRMLKHSQKPAVLRFRPSRDRTNGHGNGTVLSRQHSGGRSTGGYSSEDSSAERLRRHYERGGGSSRNLDAPKKRRSRIPLDVAKELVAAARGVDPHEGLVEGIPIADIQDGTREAHVLRVEAKRTLTAKNADKSQGQSNGNVAPKDALLRAEQEAKVLADALAKVKSKAVKYERMLEEQKKKKVLAPVIKFMPKGIVGINNNVLKELTTVLERKSFTEIGVAAVEVDENEKLQAIQKQLLEIAKMDVVVPEEKTCKMCGSTEKESKLTKFGSDHYICEDCSAKEERKQQAIKEELQQQPKIVKICAECNQSDESRLRMDEFGTYYCDVCWKRWEDDNGGDTMSVDDLVIEPTIEAPAPVPVPVSVSEPEPVPTSPPLQRAETSPYSQLSEKERAEEETNARNEAKRQLDHMHELPRTQSMRVDRMAPNDRMKRNQHGLEEFAQALKDMEEQARANGDLALAEKLNAQRTRKNWAELGLVPRDRSAPSDSMRSGNTSTMGQNIEAAASSPDLRQGITESEFPSTVDLKRATSLNPPSSSSTSSTASPVTPTAAPAPDPIPMPISVSVSTPVEDAVKEEVEDTGLEPAMLPVIVATPNEYDDGTNTDAESEDVVEMTDDEEELRIMRKNNSALAKQLGQAQDFLQFARQSIIGPDDDDDEPIWDMAKFNELSNLMQEAENDDDVNRLHPPDDDDDSSSGDSDGEEGEGDGEDDGDEGVWI